MDDPSAIGKKLGFYAITVVCGLVVHGLFILPMMYFFITKKNPIVFIRGILQALLIALATSSRYYTVSRQMQQNTCQILNPAFSWEQHTIAVLEQIYLYLNNGLCQIHWYISKRCVSQYLEVMCGSHLTIMFLTLFSVSLKNIGQKCFLLEEQKGNKGIFP